jgi:hypothetical protein
MLRGKAAPVVVWLVALTASCGDGVHSVSNLGEPLEILRARVEGRPGEGVPEQRLAASLLWEAFPQALIACLEQANGAEEVFACTTPQDFRSTLASNSTAYRLTSPSAFEVPLHTLPSPRVLSGQGSSLLGLGALVVYDDGNQNGALDLVAPEATGSADTILAASLSGDGKHTTFVLYREGALSSLWKLFETFDCPEPGQGFSVLTMVEHSAAERECTVEPAGAARIDVFFDDSRRVRELICEPPPTVSTFPVQPPPAAREITCHFHDRLEFVIDPGSYCQHEQAYDLSGCDQVVGCTQPDWDLTGEPPDWWPCTGASDGGFSISDDQAILTSRSDRLFSIHYDQGEETYPLDEIELWVRTGPMDILVFTHPGVIRFVDEDGDALFSPGDTLETFEPFGTDVFNHAHNDEHHKVSLEQSTDLVRVKTLAELTWFAKGLKVVEP